MKMRKFRQFFRPRPAKMIINVFLKVSEKANKWLKNSKNTKILWIERVSYP